MASLVVDTLVARDAVRRAGAARAAAELGVPFLGEIPLNTPIRRFGDAGQPDKCFVETPDYVQTAIQAVVQNVAGQISIKSMEQTLATLNRVMKDIDQTIAPEAHATLVEANATSSASFTLL